MQLDDRRDVSFTVVQMKQISIILKIQAVFGLTEKILT